MFKISPVKTPVLLPVAEVIAKVETHTVNNFLRSPKFNLVSDIKSPLRYKISKNDKKRISKNERSSSGLHRG